MKISPLKSPFPELLGAFIGGALIAATFGVTPASFGVALSLALMLGLRPAFGLPIFPGIKCR